MPDEPALPQSYQISWKDPAIAGNIVIAIVLNRYSSVLPFGWIVSLVVVALVLVLIWIWHVLASGPFGVHLRTYPLSCIVIFILFGFVAIQGIRSLETMRRATLPKPPIASTPGAPPTQPTMGHTAAPGETGTATATPALANPKPRVKPPQPPINPSSAPASDLAKVDKLAADYLTAHPNQLADLDAERQWVNDQLKKEGLPPHWSYVRAPWGYSPNSAQCPTGVSHITNSVAIRGKVGFEIEDPCTVLDGDKSVDSETGFRVKKP